MTTFIKMKFMKTDDQTNIELINTYRVAANIILYQDYSSIPKFMNIRQSFYVKKIYVRMSKINMFRMDVLTFLL